MYGPLAESRHVVDVLTNPTRQISAERHHKPGLFVKLRPERLLRRGRTRRPSAPSTDIVEGRAQCGTPRRTPGGGRTPTRNGVPRERKAIKAVDYTSIRQSGRIASDKSFRLSLPDSVQEELAPRSSDQVRYRPESIECACGSVETSQLRMPAPRPRRTAGRCIRHRAVGGKHPRPKYDRVNSSKSRLSRPLVPGRGSRSDHHPRWSLSFRHASTGHEIRLE